MVAAWEFFQTLQEIIDEGTCLPDQVFFNVDEILINILVFFNHIFIVAQYLKINVNIT